MEHFIQLLNDLSVLIYLLSKLILGIRGLIHVRFFVISKPKTPISRCALFFLLYSFIKTEDTYL